MTGDQVLPDDLAASLLGTINATEQANNERALAQAAREKQRKLDAGEPIRCETCSGCGKVSGYQMGPDDAVPLTTTCHVCGGSGYEANNPNEKQP